MPALGFEPTTLGKFEISTFSGNLARHVRKDRKGGRARISSTAHARARPTANEKQAIAKMESDLQAGLAASAADAVAQCDSLRIDMTLPPLHRSTGYVVQRNLLNQFHEIWQQLIQTHQTPSSICGYLTIAHVRLLRSLLAGADVLTFSQCSELGDALMATPERHVLCEVDRAMASIRRKRAAYVKAHPREFDAVTAQQYLKAWVANYEISDELRESADAVAPVGSLFVDDGDAPTAHFARFNEWVCVADASHEERSRIQEEQSRFGGTVDASGVATFGEDDAAVILERFGKRPDVELLTPQEWREAESADGQPSGALRVWAVDTSGHFYAAVSCRVEGAAGGEVMLAFNTTTGNYLQWPMAGLLHGHIFGSEPTSRDAGDEQPVGAVAELTAMGFDESAVRKALAQASGNVSRAVEGLLCGDV